MTLETTSTNGQLAKLGTPAILTPSEAVTAAIHAWVSGLDVAVQGAMFIVDTPACPDSFWPLPPDKKPWEIPGKNPKLMLPGESRESYLARRTIAAQTAGYVVRYGLGLGLAPEVSLNGIFIIGGRPSMYAEQMVALIKSHGHGHRVVERTAEQCVVQVRHRDETDWEEFTFTMADAVSAGYVKGKGPNKDGKGGNDKYNLDPKGMLYARVSSIACKTKFPDTLRGMATYEELQDERSTGDDQVATITTVSASDIRNRAAITPAAPAAPVGPQRQEQLDHSVAQNAAARAEPQQPAPAPQEQPGPAPEPATETGEVISMAQTRRLHALLRKLDLGAESDKAAALQAISFMTGRTVDSTKHLSAAEATQVLDRLDELAGKPEPKWRAEIRFMVTPDSAGQLPVDGSGKVGRD